MQSRVYITGVGCVSPYGIGYNSLIEGLYNGTKNLKDYDDKFLMSCFCRKAFFDRSKYDKIKYTSDAMLELALDEAIKSANCPDFESGTEMIIGTGINAMDIFESNIFYDIYKNNDFIKGHLDGTIKMLKQKAKFKGNCSIITTGCSSSNYSLARAVMLIRLGKADKVICGGFDPVAILPLNCFNRIFGVDPTGLKPFSKDRNGTTSAEGAGFLIIENEESVRTRNITPLAEVAGYGLSCDGYDLTAPQASGEEGAMAMKRAINDAKIETNDISCIFAHGTGTKLNDAFEVKCIQNVFKDNSERVPISAMKSLIGHSGGAANVLSFCAAIDSLKNNRIFPTLNSEPPSNDFPIDLVMENRNLNCNFVMINGFAFGGNNAIVILKKYQ